MADIVNDSRVVRVLNKGQVTIPVDFRWVLGLATDRYVDTVLEEDRIVITPFRSDQGSIRMYRDEEITRFLREGKIDADFAAQVRDLLSRGEL